MRPTKAQLRTLKMYWLRTEGDPTRVSYLSFRRSAYILFGDCLMVRWCGMTIRIEADGYGYS